MSEDVAQPAKPKRKYTPRQPAVQIQPAAPNPQIAELEAGIAPLVNQRLEANRKVAHFAALANRANLDLSAARDEFQQIEQEIQYRMQLVGQMRNGGMPVPSTPYVSQQFQPSAGYPSPDARFGYPPSPPYNPVTPYPTAPPFGVSSFPAPNQGLYPDAAPRGFVSDNPEDMANTASATDFMTPELRTQFRGGH